MAIAPVVIDFLVKGTPNVAASIRNVATTLARAEQQATRDAERAAQQRQRIADREAKAKNAIRERSATMAGQYAARSAKDAERAANAEVRAVERAEQAKQRAVEKSAANMDRIRERSATMAGRYAAQQAAKEARAAMQDASARGRDRSSAANAFFGAAGRGVAAGAQRVGSIAMQTAGVAAQLGGGFSIADSVMGQTNLRKQAAVLAASTQMAEKDKRRIGADEIYSKAKAIGTANGMDPGDVLKGFDEVKKLTGDLDQAMRVMPGVARLANATGGNLGDMSGLAANILAANPGMKDEDVERQMRVFTRQGVVGGVEVADFAKYGSRLTAGASMFGGDSSKNTATMGAIAQISRQYGGASSPAEAALAAQRFGTDVAKHSASLKAAGIDVSDKHGNLRDAQSILMDMVTKTGGDVTKLGSMGLGERGVKALTGVSAIYKNAGGGDAGRKAIAAEFGKYTNGVTEEEVSAAEKTVNSAPDKQLYGAMEQLRLAVGEALLPEFLKLVPVIRDSTPAFVALLKNGVPVFIELIKSVSDFVTANKGLIEDLAAHPIGTIIAFEVSKSIASAGLGEVVKRLLASAISGSGAGVPGVPGMAGGAGAAGGGAALGAGAILAQGYSAYETFTGARSAQAQGLAGGEAAARALATGTAEERATAEADIANAKKRSGGGASAAAWTDIAMSGLNNLGAMSGPLGMATDYAMKKSGGESRGESSLAAVKAEAFAKSADDAAGAMSRFAASANAAANGMSSGPNGTGRDTPIIDR